MVQSVKSLADAVAPIRRRHRELVEAAQTWTLSHQVVLPVDLVVLIIAVSLQRDSVPAELAPTYWTRTAVNRLVMTGLPNWCAAHRVPLPFDAPEAVWAYLDFLVDTDRLHPQSDPLAELRRPLRCYGQLDESGRWDPEGDPIAQRCECYCPYTGPTFGELSESSKFGEW